MLQCKIPVVNFSENGEAENNNEDEKELCGDYKSNDNDSRDSSPHHGHRYQVLIRSIKFRETR